MDVLKEQVHLLQLIKRVVAEMMQNPGAEMGSPSQGLLQDCGELDAPNYAELLDRLLARLKNAQQLEAELRTQIENEIAAVLIEDPGLADDITPKDAVKVKKPKFP